MSVIIRPITMAGSPPISAAFADSFNRASGNPGTSWFQGIRGNSGGSPFLWSTADIGASVIAGGQCLRWTPQGQANPTTILKAVLIPVRNITAIANKNAFVQATFIGNAGVAAERFTSGIGVLMRTDEDTGYVLECIPQIPVTTLQRINQGVITNITSVGASANGDIVRLSYVISPTQIDFTVTKNGVVVFTATDNSASRLTVGTTGFFVRGGGGAIPSNGFAEWKDFSTGLGT